MIQIEPVYNIWNDGEFVIATKLKATLFADNLTSHCSFYWELLSDSNIVINKGNLTMSGQDYKNWDGTNTKAWEFICNSLSLVPKQL